MDWLLLIGVYWSKKFLKISFVSLLCNLLIVIYIVLNTESLIQIRQAVILSELQCMIKPRMEQFWKLHPVRPGQSNDTLSPRVGPLLVFLYASCLHRIHHKEVAVSRHSFNQE